MTEYISTGQERIGQERIGQERTAQLLNVAKSFYDKMMEGNNDYSFFYKKDILAIPYSIVNRRTLELSSESFKFLSKISFIFYSPICISTDRLLLLGNWLLNLIITLGVWKISNVSDAAKVKNFLLQENVLNNILKQIGFDYGQNTADIFKMVIVLIYIHRKGPSKDIIEEIKFIIFERLNIMGIARSLYPNIEK